MIVGRVLDHRLVSAVELSNTRTASEEVWKQFTNGLEPFFFEADDKTIMMNVNATLGYQQRSSAPLIRTMDNQLDFAHRVCQLCLVL